MHCGIFARSAVRQLSVRALRVRTISSHVRLMSSAISVSRSPRDNLLPKLMTPNLQAYRYKSKKKSKKAQQEIESDDEAEEDKQEQEEGSQAPLSGDKEKILKISQLRLDKVTRHALNSTRVVDEAFLEGRLWKNESKVLKKASPVLAGDIIDVEIGPDPKNTDFIKVHRIEILEIKEGTTHSAVRAIVSKNLTIKPHSG